MESKSTHYKKKTRKSEEFFSYVQIEKLGTVDKTITTEIETFNEHNDNLAIAADSFLKLQLQMMERISRKF